MTDIHQNGADSSLALAISLMGQGRFVEAEGLLRKLVSHSPNNPQYLLLFGKVLLALGRQSDAMRVFIRVTEWGRAATSSADRSAQSQPGHYEPYFESLSNLAAQSFMEGRPNEALGLLYEAIEHGSRGQTINAQFANYLCATNYTVPRPDLKPVLARALKEAWIMSTDLVRAFAPLLLLEPAFREILRQTADPGASAAAVLAAPHAHAIASDQLLLAILNEAMVTDPVLERLLVALRSALLQARTGQAEQPPDKLDHYVSLTVALANQCFTNEYAFSESRSERLALAELEARLENSVRTKQAVDNIDLAVLACYRPLDRLSWADMLVARSWPDILEPLITRQLREPATEREVRQTIPRLTDIANPTSELVRRQYEENPYPRWIRTPPAGRRFTLDEWLRMHFPYLPPSGRSATGPLEVLVAGCGTGQDAIGSAQRFVASNLLAVDLSQSSLAYAVRKTAELGLTNVVYAQADILELGRLGRQFDVIECAGVLHHLADPNAGWRILSDLCVPGGYMLMALYSERGRDDLRPVADLIAARGYGTSPGELRRFRSDILALEEPHKARQIVSVRDDFYNLSMLRDLVFHVQEHRFTIPKIADALHMLGLQFCGFGVAPNTANQFRNRFWPNANPASLELWNTFESENPDTFASMYHFVVRKPA